jgi:hypothetical protein
MSAGLCGPFGFIGGQTFRLYEGGRRGSKGEGGRGKVTQGIGGVTGDVCGCGFDVWRPSHEVGILLGVSGVLCQSWP